MSYGKIVKTQITYLNYAEELQSFILDKDEIEKLKEDGIIADIRLPSNISQKKSANSPLLGFLLGEDKHDNGKACYSVSKNYIHAMLNTGAQICFLDYENPAEQLQTCDGVVLPGGNFDFPEDFFISGKNLGTGIGKRFFAYKTVIEVAYKKKMPMLGICAGAQMIGAVLGKMKMYTFLKEEIPHPNKHKPTKKGEVCMHKLKLVSKSPIYSIMDIPVNQEFITINSRHAQAMVHSELQSRIKTEPIVKMEIYAIDDRDGIPEIWGNENDGILCVQGHPEDLAIKGNKYMQNLYNYVMQRSARYKQNHIAKFNKVKDEEIKLLY